MYYAARRVHDSDRDSFTFWRQYYRPGKLHTSCALNQEAGIMGNVRFSHVYKIDIEVNGCGLKVVTYAAATMSRNAQRISSPKTCLFRALGSSFVIFFAVIVSFVRLFLFQIITEIS